MYDDDIFTGFWPMVHIIWIYTTKKGLSNFNSCVTSVTLSSQQGIIINGKIHYEIQWWWCWIKILNRIEHIKREKNYKNKPEGRGRAVNMRMKVREMIHDLFAPSSDTFTHILGLLWIFFPGSSNWKLISV